MYNIVMIIQYDDNFDSINKDRVFTIEPSVYNDDRGNFSEVLKQIHADAEKPIQATSTSWIKQINRSTSKGGTIRGCHAQKGSFCQGKLVEAINTRIYDIITDARPDSSTFAVSKIYVLDPVVQNKLWVPRGFLHGFIVPKNTDNAIFQYYCDNVYDKQSEIYINPTTILPNILHIMLDINPQSEILQELCEIVDVNPILSEKDSHSLNYSAWMKEIKTQYENEKELWYK